MIPKCKKKFHWNVKKKKKRKMFVNTFACTERVQISSFAFFHSFHPSPVYFLARESKTREKKREREQQNVVVAVEGFSERTWLAPPSRSFHPSSAKITGGDRDRFYDCAPALRIAHPRAFRWKTRWILLERKEKKKKKKGGERETREVQKGREKKK